MTALRSSAAFLAAAMMMPLPALSADYAAAARSLEIMGFDLSRKQKRHITAQFSAVADGSAQDWHDQSVALLDDMAELSQEARRVSTRIRVSDLHRQLVERLVPGDNLARELLNEKDPQINQVELGVGMTNRDMGWAIMLEALRIDMPDDPRDLEVAEGQPDKIVAFVSERFRDGGDGARHFLARVDSWGMGTVSAWADMSLEERKLAASAVTEAEIPPEAVLQKVIGTSNILYWAAGVDIGLTEAEKAHYPELAAYLAEGHLAGGVATFIGAKMDDSLAASTIIHGTTEFLFDYNMELLFSD
jgi:hypothetical protein